MSPTRTALPSRRTPRARPTGADLAGLARLSALATVLGLVLLALLGVGRRLPTPPLGVTAARSTEAWTRWLTRVGPAGATMSVIRVVALALAAYLLLLVAIEVVGRAVGLPRLLSLGHLVSTPRVRQFIGGVAGVGVALSLAAATVGPAGAASADTRRPRSSTETTAPPSTGPTVADSPVMRALDPADPPTSADRTTMTSLESQPPVMRAVDASPDPAPSTTATLEPAPTSTSVTPAAPTDPTAPTGPAASSPVAPTATDQWVIRGGDHLWGVARRTLAGSWHRAPTDAETARYLDRLVEANLEVLVVPGDADLVLPGQVFQLPPVPAG